MSALSLVLLLLGASVLAVVVFRRFNLPPVLGYLLVGSIIGPHALNLMHDVHRAEYLAEFGVVFLMFSIGLEFSLPKLIYRLLLRGNGKNDRAADKSDKAVNEPADTTEKEAAR